MLNVVCFFLVVAFSSFMQSFFKMREASSLCLDSQLAVSLAIQEVRIGAGELGSHLGETSSLNTSVTIGRLIPVRLTGDTLWWGRPPLARWHDCHFDWLRRQSRDWVNLEVPRVGFFESLWQFLHSKKTISDERMSTISPVVQNTKDHWYF